MNYDFPGLKIGVATDEAGPTGCTVISLPKWSLLTADIRGGAPGTVMGTDGYVDAVCFAGGSLYGLEASAGVAAAIAKERGFPTEVANIPIVRGAIIYDFRGEGRTNVAPTKALGEAAYRAAAEGSFPSGRVGAGRSATVGKMGSILHHPEIAYESGGQGAEYGTFTMQSGREFKVFVCTVVNALGAIVDRSGQVVRGHLDADGKRWSASDIRKMPAGGNKPKDEQRGGNTTISLVATNFPCSDFFARQAARQIHTSMARAIDPFHTQDDGDVLYFVRMGNTDWGSATADEWEEGSTHLGILGAQLMWDAVLDAVRS